MIAAFFGCLVCLIGMKKHVGFYLLTLLIAQFVALGVFAQSDDDLRPSASTAVIQHKYYQLEYAEEHEQAKWLYYTITPEFLDGPGVRKDNFKPDPLVQTGSAELSDYVRSGYDRGHLCPAAAMTLNQVAMDESFFMSNMSPQNGSFNRGKWKSLEEQVRDWVRQEQKLHVVSGPIFENNAAPIGANQVTVPGFYYKVIYDPTEEQKMIAFIMPNQKLSGELSEYVVSVDEVEARTGIDFFYALPDKAEVVLEQKRQFWDEQFDYDALDWSESTEDELVAATATRLCAGISSSTKQPCDNRTTNANGYCHLHQNQLKDDAGQCAGTTLSDRRCKRKVGEGESRCWWHKIIE